MTRREYDPAKHGSARVFRGECAEARVAGTVDGHDGVAPPARLAEFHSPEARATYVEAWREHSRPGQQLAMF